MEHNAIIEIDSLSYRYPKGRNLSLKEVNYRVKAPKFTAIMGPTGAGKTTLTAVLNGLIPQLYEGNIKGRVLVQGMDTQKFRIQTLVSNVGLVMQDPETQIFGITVQEDVAFGPSNLGLNMETIKERIPEALKAVRLEGYEDRLTSELSGGEKQRLAIAGVLAMQPEVLVLDEPTSELDPVGRSEIYAVVDRLRRHGNLTVLAVEHSSEDIAMRADEVLVINDGKVVWQGEPRLLFCNAPLLQSVGVRPPQVSEYGWQLYQQGLIEQADIPLTVEEAAAVTRKILSDRTIPASSKSVSVKNKRPDSDSPVAVEIKDLHHDYGSVQALRGVNLTIKRGEFVALVGQNGAGKTTLVKHLNNLLQPTTGEVYVDGVSTAGQSIGDLSRRVGYVFQNPDHQIFCSTVREEITYGLRHLDLSSDEIEQKVQEVLGFVGLKGVTERHPFTLGKGERQRLAVASILAMEPNILVVDEPTTGQDWAGAQDMMNLIRNLNREGHTIIMITHDMPIVAEYAQRVVVMHRGQIISDGTPAEVFCQENVLHQASLVPPQITQLAIALADVGMPADVITVDQAVELVTAAACD
ncbi:MAG TPA: ATP-binding cassette domain-containing protein [Firmicutes bacterium]|nr:ATP-binding cassette domain-containing protein [Bacillota bacterium]